MRMKSLYLAFDTLLAGIWGLTIIDLLVLFDLDSLSLMDIDSGIKTALALVGVLYLVFIKFPNEYRMNRLNRKMKREEIEKLKLENEYTKEEHDEEKK